MPAPLRLLPLYGGPDVAIARPVQPGAVSPPTLVALNGVSSGHGPYSITTSAGGTPTWPAGKGIVGTIIAKVTTGNISEPQVIGGSDYWFIKPSDPPRNKRMWVVYGVGNGNTERPQVIFPEDVTGPTGGCSWEFWSHDNADTSFGGAYMLEEYNFAQRTNGNAGPPDIHLWGMPAGDPLDMTMMLGYSFNLSIGANLRKTIPSEFSLVDATGTTMELQLADNDFNTFAAWAYGEQLEGELTTVGPFDFYGVMVKIRSATSAPLRHFRQDHMVSWQTAADINGSAGDTTAGTAYNMGTNWGAQYTPLRNSLMAYPVGSVKSGGSAGPTGVTANGITLSQIDAFAASAINLVSGTQYDVAVASSARFAAGDPIQLRGFTTAGFNGRWSVLSVPDATHVRVDIGSNPGATSAGTITRLVCNGDLTLTVWYGMTAAPALNRPQVSFAATGPFGGNQDGVDVTGFYIPTVATGGTNGSGAIGLVTTGTGNATGLVLPLMVGDPASAESAVVAAFLCDAAQASAYPFFTPGPGFTYIDRDGTASKATFSTPSTTLITQWTNKFTPRVECGIPGTTRMLGIAFEVIAGTSQTLSPGIINQVGTPLGPVVKATTTPALIDQSGVLFAPRVNQQVQAGLIDQHGTLFSPTASLGSVQVAPALIDRSATLLAPSVNLQAKPGLIDQSGTLFAPKVNQQVQVPLVDQSGTLFTPQVNVAGAGTAQTVRMSAFALTETGRWATTGLDEIGRYIHNGITETGQRSFPSAVGGIGIIDQHGTLFSPIFVAPQQVQAGLIDQHGTLSAPAIPQQVQLALLSQVGVIFGPTLNTGTTSIAVPLIDQHGTVFAASAVTQQVRMGLLDYSPTLIPPTVFLAGQGTAISYKGGAYLPVIFKGGAYRPQLSKQGSNP